MLVSLNVFAGFQEDFDQLKNTGQNFEPDGTVYEEIARLRFQEKFPQPEYAVFTGIEYSDNKTDLTVGELDLVVFNNQTHKAIVVAEVKCWKSPKGGLKKAKEQRQRFNNNMSSGKGLTFTWLADPKVKLNKNQFDEIEQFYFIGPKGTQEFGFDFELDYILSELMELRKELLNCQSFGDCAKSTP